MLHGGRRRTYLYCLFGFPYYYYAEKDNTTLEHTHRGQEPRNDIGSIFGCATKELGTGLLLCASNEWIESLEVHIYIYLCWPNVHITRDDISIDHHRSYLSRCLSMCVYVCVSAFLCPLRKFWFESRAGALYRLCLFNQMFIRIDGYRE